MSVVSFFHQLSSLHLFLYHPSVRESRFHTLTPSPSTPALIIAVLTIFIRSCFRVAELRGGFGGNLANNETTYIILESTMIAVAALALTVVHPAFVFGQYWKLSLAKMVFSPTQVEIVDGNGLGTKA